MVHHLALVHFESGVLRDDSDCSVVGVTLDDAIGQKGLGSREEDDARHFLVNRLGQELVGNAAFVKHQFPPFEFDEANVVDLH